jgi:electron transfer flavoprotein beta subunit
MTQASSGTRPTFAVCWKAVELRARVDPLTGAVSSDAASLGVSAADEAALEWALRCADRFGGAVRVVSVGSPAAEGVLRAAGAAGGAELVRVDAPDDLPSEAVADLLAETVGDAALVWCGDVSHDRGSGSVPAFLAHSLSAAQALGLVGVQVPEAVGDARAGGANEVVLVATRRLDGGRRELLEVRPPAVLSCEGGTARLRRAPLPGLLSARERHVRVVEPAAGRHAGSAGARVRVLSVAPFRPRARPVPPPPGSTARDRIRALTGIATEPRVARAVTLDPTEAAAAIVQALESWGELP